MSHVKNMSELPNNQLEAIIYYDLLGEITRAIDLSEIATIIDEYFEAALLDLATTIEGDNIIIHSRSTLCLNIIKHKLESGDKIAEAMITTCNTWKNAYNKWEGDETMMRFAFEDLGIVSLPYYEEELNYMLEDAMRATRIYDYNHHTDLGTKWSVSIEDRVMLCKIWVNL